MKGSFPLQKSIKGGFKCMEDVGQQAIVSIVIHLFLSPLRGGHCLR